MATTASMRFTRERFPLQDFHSRHALSCELIRYRDEIESAKDAPVDCESLIEMILPDYNADAKTPDYFHIVCRHFPEVDLPPGAQATHSHPTINMLQQRTSGVRKPELPTIGGNPEFQRALLHDLESKRGNTLDDAKKLGTYDQAKKMLELYERLISAPNPADAPVTSQASEG